MKISKEEHKSKSESQYNENYVKEIIKGEIAKKENFTLLLKGKKKESISLLTLYRKKAIFKLKKISKPYINL